jgi:hypothetical protein
MIVRIVFAVLLAALAFPMLSRAEEVKWEVIRIYKLYDGRAVAVALPAEWQELRTSNVLEKSSSGVQFLNEHGAKVEIPMTALLRGASSKSIVRADDARDVALRPSRKSS